MRPPLQVRKRFREWLIGVSLGITAWFPPQPTCAADWVHWRGTNRTGIVDAPSGWLAGRDWLSGAPAWRAEVGEGGSSPLLIGGRIYALGHRDGLEQVSCLDAKLGQMVWNQRYSAPRYGRNATGDEGLYSGPSATPEFDPETQLLYTLGADGDLQAWDTSRGGASAWQINLYDQYQMPQRARVGRSGRRDYGYTSAPLVHRDWLIVEAGGAIGTLVAFDKRTGTEAWRSQARGLAGHTAGMAPIVVEGVPCLAALTFDGLLVVRLDPPRAGETVATYAWITDFANNVAGPAVRDDCVLITSEYNHRSMCKLRVTLRGVEKIWEQPYASKACTPVIYGDQILVAWDRLRCLDWNSGKLLWEGPRVGDAGSCVVTSDRKLIVWCDKGDLLLAELANQGKPEYQELARRRQSLESDVWPHLLVADGAIVCRDRLGTMLGFQP